MKGFFEHQYLSYKKNHLKNLLALANADGNIHKKELELLFKIGKKYGLKDWQIQNLVDSKETFELNIPDNFHDRMNLLYDLMLMVYADGKVEKREIEFCEDVAKRFKMQKAIVTWLLDKFDRGLPPPPDLWEEMKEYAREKYTKA
ncbi:MAG: TerB family tellurite resistance protein [Cyclobacteriaceae bacterium]|nr:TerB family tellurite resistance protein [Cyclobacteriaceae bacterium]UYN85457.1 MAG: TerB family tellurite resistance protein [Cyclobacteriaceae bacterium]